MPTKTGMIRFGSLSPDGGEIGNPGLIRSRNFQPYAGAKIPVGDYLTLSKLMTKATTALHATGFAASLGDYSYLVFAGHGLAGTANGTIHEVSSIGAIPWDTNDRSSGAYTIDSTGFHFCQFGSHMVAVGGHAMPMEWLENGAHPIAASRPAAATNFTTTGFTFGHPATDPNKTVASYNPRFVTAIDNRIMIANIKEVDSAAVTTYYTNRVHWSGTDDCTTFSDAVTTPAILSDYQDLIDDYGTIQGLSGGGDYSLVFKSRAIYRMSPNTAFQYAFQPVKIGYGTRFSHSIVRVDSDVYFWGPNGPAVYRGVNGIVEELALGRISRSLLDSTWISGNDLSWDSTEKETVLSAAHDVSNGCVVWMVPAPSARPYLLCYDYVANEFSAINPWDVAVGFGTYLCLFSNPDTGDAFYPLRDVLYITKDDILSRSYVGGYVSGGEGTANGGYSAIKTSYFDFANAQLTIIRRVRPVMSLNSGETVIPAITINVYSKLSQLDGSPITTTGTSAAAKDRLGWITLPACPQRPLHQIEMLISATDRDHIAEIEGVEVEFEVMGTR